MRNIRWNIVLYTFLSLSAVVGVVMLMGLVSSKDKNQECTSLMVSIEGKETFIDQNDISKMINNHFGVVVGKKISEIDLEGIEKVIEKLPYVSKAEVYADIDGVMKVRVEQREVILRVINKIGQEYYVDRNGNKIPVTLKYVPRVLVANGHISEGYSNALEPVETVLVQDLIAVVNRVMGDHLWENQIVQIYVNNQGDIEFVPRVGTEILLIGSSDNLDDKLRRLEIYYKNILPKVGTEAYEKVNVKYREQIICERRDGWYIDSLQMKINSIN